MTRAWDREKNLSPQQESNTWPPEHWVGALSTELRELMGSKVILTEFICPTLVSCWSIHLSHFITKLKKSPSLLTCQDKVIAKLKIITKIIAIAVER